MGARELAQGFNTALAEDLNSVSSTHTAGLQLPVTSSVEI